MGVIKKIVNGVVVEVDDTKMVRTIENGVVVEKPLSEIKKKQSSDIGLKFAAVGGQATPFKVRSVSEALSGNAPKEEEVKHTPESISDYNKQFESFTGHKPLDLSEPEKPKGLLSQDAYNTRKKLHEEAKFVNYRNIEKNEINPVLSGVETGTIKPEKLKELYNKPYGKNLVSGLINNIAPEAGSMALQDTDYGNEQRWDKIAHTINVKQRPKGVEAQNQQIFQLDNDIYNELDGVTVINAGVTGGTGGAAGHVDEHALGKIDTNNAEQISGAISALEDATGVTKGGAKYDKDALIEKLKIKLFFLSSQKEIHPEVYSLDTPIRTAIARVNMIRERGENIPTSEYAKNDEINRQHFLLGLNFIKDAKPGQYQNIVKALKEKEFIADTDFEELSGIGQHIYNQKMFVEGASNPDAVGAETNIKYDSYQTKKAEYARILSEEAKSFGYKNRLKIPSSVIDKLAARHPELTNTEIIDDIKKDEANGGYGIVKGGALNALFRGVAAPIKGINTTINAMIDSPVDTYLNSKRLDYGDQLIANKKGVYEGELPSERGSIFNDIIEGAGQFIPQVFLAKGLGKGIQAPLNAGLKFVPRAALTAAQESAIAIYPATMISTFMQTYGSSYTDFLQKTGDPSKAKLMASIDATAQAGLESFIMPDVKIADKAMGLLKNAKATLATDILKVVSKGGGRELVKPIVKEFLAKSANILGQEVLENTSQQFENYLTEAIFSPTTVKDRDLGKEIIDTIQQTAIQMILPAVFGGAGETKAQRPFGKQGLHAAAINFDSFKESLDKGLANNTISEQDYNQALAALTLHRDSIKNAPKKDAEGELISSERQLEYAYQNTIAEYNQQLADNQPDKIQKEVYLKKVEEADKIKRKIFYGEKVEGLPQKEAEVELPPNPKDLIQKAIDDKVLKGMDVDMAKAALSQEGGADEFLKSIAEQALNKIAPDATAEADSMKRARETYGDDLVDLAIQRFPKEDATKPADQLFPEGNEVPEEKVSEPQGGKNELTGNADLMRDILDEFSSDKEDGGVLLMEEKDNIHKAINKYEEGEISGEELKKVFTKNGVDENYLSKKMVENGMNKDVQLPQAKTDETIPQTGAENKQSQQQATETGEPIKPTTEVGKETEGQQQAAEPPVTEPPANEPPTGKPGDENKNLNDKGILNHLYNAKNVPQSAKEGFEKEGLKYQTKSQEEAQAVAKSVVDELGIDDAIDAAKSMKFDGDVNSLIFAESLNRLKEQEDAATTPEEKIAIAAKFAEIGIQYDTMARYGGRFNAAINHFYKKSPLGIVMMENAKRKEEFNQWAKPKDASWKEYFEELKKDPDFAAIMTEQVKEGMKQERAASREARKKKVHDFFDDAIDKLSKGGMTYATIIPPKVAKVALEAMKKAYDAGELVVKIIEDAVDYISKELGNQTWDKDKFRKEWESKFGEKNGGKKPLTDEEAKMRVLDKFRKKIKGLTEKQKDEVIRRSIVKLTDAGALDYKDFREIIGQVIGRNELTVEEAAKMKELVSKTNALEDAAKKVRDEKTPQSLLDYRKAQVEAGKATRELNRIIYNKADIVKRLTSIMQLSTLGIPALVNNPIYNIWNQATLRFPIGIINTLIDKGVSLAAKATGRKFDREYNIIAGQAKFWEALGLGAKESFEQIVTGLNRRDYTTKEVYGQQIRPMTALKDLYEYSQGRKNLTRNQYWDKIIQASIGAPAEVVARVLNLGDKPQRFGAEGAQGAAFAKILGLKGIDAKIFVEFPKEEAYKIYKGQGFSDAEAEQKADYIKQAIEKEGMRSTFQQDNLLNNALTAGFGVLGGKDSGVANLTKTLAISPYIKIPSNAFWSFYNLLNPEVAMVQAMTHAEFARRFKNKGETTKSKLQNREARYWIAHAIVGIASRAVIVALVKNGTFVPSADDDDSKKERDANTQFDKPGYINIGDMKISNRWFGQWGMLGNAIAKRYQDETPEQREAQDEFWNLAFGGMELDGLKELENGIFANSSALFEAISNRDFSRYGMNTINLMANIIQPATFAQINRAALDEVPTSKGDTFLDKLNNNFAQRSTLYRRLFDVQLESKRDIWGQPIPKGGNVLSRMFGISKANPQMFARPIYNDYLKTGDSGFLPPSVLPIINGQKLNTKQEIDLQNFIGSERKKLVEPYVNDMAKIKGFNDTYSEIKDLDDKKYVLQRLYDKGRKRGESLFYNKYPELRPKVKKEDYNKEVKQDVFNELLNVQDGEY